ncbi:MAG: hypothetical protein HY347_03185 [candidate division NC10 bacterium]|nr:hypothetical protein [candidate division NC10 bacterium]
MRKDAEKPPQEEGAFVPKKKEVAMLSWSSSPALERIAREFEAQQRLLEEAKRSLEERLVPFQRSLTEQRRGIEQAMRNLEARIKPFRQYLQNQEQNLERVVTHLNAELDDQFSPFGRYLAEQRRILERAARYLEEKPKPLLQYLEEQQGMVELIFKDIEERMDLFGRHLKEQQKILEALAEPQVREEFEALASFMSERQRALDRYASSGETRPDELFAELEQIHEKYKELDGPKRRLLARILEQSRLADERLREALRSLPQEPPGGGPLET